MSAAIIFPPDRPSQHPTQKTTLGNKTVCEIAPTGQACGHSGYCKYCSRTHAHWWNTPEAEYPAPALLCGYCEHVSLTVYTT
jgi:hypothetical protein